MKTVLIPTDFNIENIKIIDVFNLRLDLEKVNFIFLHALKVSDSISDLLMLSRRSRDYENVSDEFYNELERMKEKYPQQVGSISVEYFYGNTVVAFKNLLEDREVDFILCPKNYTYKPINKYSVDPNILLSRCGYPVVSLDLSVISEEGLFESRMREHAAPTINVI